MRIRAFVPAVALIVLFGSACSSNDDHSLVETGGQTTAAKADHNDADVEFAQLMIPHHEQAVEMAQLAATRAENADVKDLAGRIEAAQSPEIVEMTGWLTEWGEDVEPNGGGMDHDESGMMSDAEMTELEGASGTAFDRMFLEMMVAHHTSAIEMAEAEIADGQFPDALAMAEAIKSAQQSEIAEMEGLLEQL